MRLIPFILPLLPLQDADATVRREAWAMGTRLTIEVAAPTRERAMNAAQMVSAEIGRVEALLTTWDEDSPTSRLNRAPVGETVAVSPELSEWLGLAFSWADRTRGAFSPNMGALMRAWRFREGGVRPSSERLAELVVDVGRGWTVHPGEVVRHRTSAHLDTGAFGKGVALALVGDSLRARGVRRAVVDLGGQLLLIGEEAPHSVSVAHPAQRDLVLADLNLRGVSVATSGQSERFIELDGERFGHVLDPRTGLPVKAWGSVTVVHPDPVAADVLATALFVMGPDEGLTWAQEHAPEAGVLFLELAGERVRPRWTPGLERLAPDLSLKSTY